MRLHVVSAQAAKFDLDVVDQLTPLLGFDDNIVYICLDRRPYVFSENMEHAPLVRRPNISKYEGHGHVTIHTKEGDERSRELVRLLHFYLMVAGISIKERKGFTSYGRIDNLINAW
jgi:hypothetical protein